MTTYKSRKAKGRNLQNYVRDELLNLLNDVTTDDVQSRIMGVAGEDIVLSSSARKQFPYSTECKNQEKISLWSAWEQCRSNANGHEPLLIVKRNHTQPLVVMDSAHFFWTLYKTIISARTIIEKEK